MCDTFREKSHLWYSINREEIITPNSKNMTLFSETDSVWKSVWIKGPEHGLIKVTNPLQSSHEIHTTPFSGSARKNTRQAARWEKPFAIISMQTRVTSQLVWLVLQRRRIKKKKSLSKMFLCSNFTWHIQEKNLKDKKNSKTNKKYSTLHRCRC